MIICFLLKLFINYVSIYSEYNLCWLLVTFNLSKTLIVLFVCLAFIGQAMATTVMPYQMMSMMKINVQETSKSMSMMEHCKRNKVNASAGNIKVESLGTVSLATSEKNNSEASTESCCNQVCNCFTGGCASVAVLIKSAITTHYSLVDPSFKILSYSNLALSQQPTSLYRPPILS